MHQLTIHSAIRINSHPSWLGILLGSIIFLSIGLGCQNENQPINTSSQRDETNSTVAKTVPEKSKPDANTKPDESDSESLIIGLDADMSSGSAKSGEAIRRGIELALDKINRNGGILGKTVQLKITDHRGNPDRGVDNLMELSELPNLLAVVGGIHTPVALKELSTIHERKILYLGPWAAGTPIVDNGYDPNYVFRVSVRDEYVGGFLVKQALNRDLKKMGLLLERTGWGRSNEIAITNALADLGMKPTSIQWFNWGEKEMQEQISNLFDDDVDVILMVCNPLEGAEIVNSLASLPTNKRVPVISHWGISAGDFFENTKVALKNVDVSFIQSFSFLSTKQTEQAKQLAQRYMEKFDCDSPRKIFSPAGTAHAYEIVMMLAKAVENAQSTKPEAVRKALEQIKIHSGVIRNYAPPFEPGHHDALNADDLILARFDSDGAISPVNN